jgi:ligand-binding SRPBCC domain-containing protein
LSRAHVIAREQLVRRPRREVFAFFADAANLQEITPPFLRFRILTPLPIEMRPGALITYRLSLLGVPFRWRTRIVEWRPDERFVDEQLEGPYRRWWHEHTFEETAGGTRVRDRVEYELPLGPLGGLARRLFVAPRLEAIFAFRRQAIERRFA